jgi:hypothetical protein
VSAEPEADTPAVENRYCTSIEYYSTQQPSNSAYSSHATFIAHARIPRCPQSYPSSFLSFACFYYSGSSISEGYLVRSGSCAFNLSWSISELTADSNLSRLYYLINSSSVPGRLITRIAPPVRYLNMGAAWALNTKHKGTANVNSTGGCCSTFDTHSHTTEFAAAGQDAIAVVIPSVLHYGRDPNSKKQTCRLPLFLGRALLYTLRMLLLSK